MNPNVSSSLLHFTKTIDALKGILSRGFRYSYCSEEFPMAVINNVVHRYDAGFEPNNFCNGSGKVLIPMVSFCDIPLTRAEVHSSHYGKYIVGIDKDLARNVYRNMMPVQYMAGERFRMALSELSMFKCSELAKNEPQVDDSINIILSSTKMYEIYHQGNFVKCYNEREWRVVLPDRDNHRWGWILHDGESKEAYNKKLHQQDDIFLSFMVDDDDNSHKIIEETLPRFITHIVVDKESEVGHIVDYILDQSNSIFGYKLSLELRKLLVSKISSFERLSDDY